ncbi:hypothetical protein E8E12_008538 [Didymella heteroderae]|uniref:G protein-coupled receptor GPR1/2/3 C-terminal domain-containing protein n=1 Tax=Didymella heteroderae TaxID=1769908 RepID=A0A9P4WYV9_9PLEO|nr:hypothetical protein E8E12_008538 [Didymella heteroderae]
MIDFENLDAASNSFELPPHIHPWLRAVVALGFISFVASVTLLFILTYKLILWHIKSKRSNQFVILIFNLLWADIQQALAFLLNVEWLRLGSLQVENPICFAQGWLVSTGDLGSGVWCFAIGLHTFASVILDYRLKPKAFYGAVAAAWIFIIGVSSIGVGIHGENFEFGNVLIYAIIYGVLLHRIHTGYYTPEESKRVRTISNLMVVYPIVYVICTLPLASARMAAMTGEPPSLARLCLSGAMITSNGWLDVLLYTCTRRIMIFSDEPPSDDNGFDTFSPFWKDKPTRFGGETTIEALNSKRSRRNTSRSAVVSGRESLDDLFPVGNKDIKLVMTTHVTSEPANDEDFEEIEGARKHRPRSPLSQWSEETKSMKNNSPI